MADYSLLERALHRLALGSSAVAEMMFDAERALYLPREDGETSDRHVFVSGLARSGTTVMLRRMYDSGEFRSLTYGDMPFVLAPNTWAKLRGSASRKTDLSERAHGDGIYVNQSSPESFDEVFWRVFTGSDYIGPDKLTPYRPSQESIDRFREYIRIVLAKTPGKRYLSKNNNNILRITGLAEAFPNSIFLIPFRDPLSHAESLLRQHRLFCKRQDGNPFELTYMNWLSHHEFGLGHRRFNFGKVNHRYRDANDINYWLEIWTDAYSWLRDNDAKNCHFVCYEDMCRDPGVWQNITKLIEIPSHTEPTDQLRAPRKPEEGMADTSLVACANELYETLRTRAVPGGHVS